VYLLIQSSTVQTIITKQLASYLSNQLKVKVSVGKVGITFTGSILLDKLFIEDKHHDTLFYGEEFIIKTKRIDIEKRELIFNFINISSLYSNIKYYKGENDLNIQFLIDYFKTDDTTSQKPWQIEIAQLNISNSKVKYKDEDARLFGDRFDYDDVDVRHVNADIENVKIVGDSIIGMVNNISAYEKSGLLLKRFNGFAYLGPHSLSIPDLEIYANNSEYNFNLKFLYEKYSDYYDFEDKIYMQLDLLESKFIMSDIGCFAPELKGMGNYIDGTGKFFGSISNFKLRDVDFHYGSGSVLKGDFDFKGLPYINETYMHFNVEDLTTIKADLEKFELPESSDNKYVDLPQNIKNLGKIKYKGRLTGFFYDFVSYGNVYTDLGNISTDLWFDSKESEKYYKYKGKLSADNFDIGKFIGDNTSIGLTSFNLDIDGVGKSGKDVNIDFKGKIRDLEFKKYTYKNLVVDANYSTNKLNGNLIITEENIKLNINGLIDFSKKNPHYQFYTELDNVRLNRLNVFGKDKNNILKANIKIDLTGKTIDDILGQVEVSNLYLKEFDDTLKINRLMIISDEELNGKSLKLISDIADININGSFYFKDIYNDVLNYLNQYIRNSEVLTLKDYKPNTENYDFFINLKKANGFFNIFYPSINIADNSFVNGSFNNYQKELNLSFISDSLIYQTTKFDNISMDIESDENRLLCKLNSQKLFIGGKICIEKFVSDIELKDDSINFIFDWKKSINNNNSGDIKGNIVFDDKISIYLQNSKINVSDSIWKINPVTIIIDKKHIFIDDFSIEKNNEKISVYGNISDSISDNLYAGFSNLNLQNLNPITSAEGYELNGRLNGMMELSNLFGNVNIISNVNVKDLVINEHELGDINFVNVWENESKAIKTNISLKNGNVKTLEAEGYYYSEKPDKEKIDLNIKLDKFDIAFFEQYLTSFSSKLEGTAAGNVRLTGSFNKPELNGTLNLRQGRIKIDYLNTEYSFANPIKITKNSFVFDKWIVFDNAGNPADVTGVVSHQNFYNFKYDFKINAKKTMCLNTNFVNNDLYYGEAFASGNAHLKGDEKSIDLKVNARTEKGTRIFVPIDYVEDYSDNNLISFMEKNTQNKNLKEQNNIDLSWITMDMNIDVSNDAEIQIIFDSKIGDIMRGNGTGNLKFEINKEGKFFMYGDYIIENGDYLFTLQNIINKKFRVERGGLIRWKGDPYDADVNLNAIYNLRTTLYDIIPDSTNENIKKRIPVQCILGLNDKLFNPSITFKINLPSSDEYTKTMVSNVISTDEELNKQVFSLLLLNRFTNPNPVNADNFGSGVGTTSSEMLSNQLSNWLSHINSDIDIGVNYRAGNKINSDELELALSKQFFNNRLVIDGNVGVANQKTSNIVGDVNVELKINREGSFRVKAFNKSNNNEILNYTNTGHYTQGVGIFYRREFDNFFDFFRRKKKKIKAQDN